LLKSLPAMLWVRSRDDAFTLDTLDSAGRRVQTIKHVREKEWWQASVQYLVSETATPGPGNRAVLARLAESLFLELLRWQLQFATQGHGGGWLAGLHDPQVGPALTLLHAQPERPWTGTMTLIGRARYGARRRRTRRSLAASITRLTSPSFK